MTNPCTTCPDALQDGFCSRYDSRTECRDYRHYTETEARNRRLERIFERQAALVNIKLRIKRQAEKED